MEIFVGQDEGRWPRGTRVEKVHSVAGDTHQDGAQGAIVGALGPTTAAQRAELIIKHPEDGDVEYLYWVEWDDIPSIPVAITDNRIKPVEEK